MFERFPETDPGMTSTIFMKFFEAEIIDEKFCLQWKNGELDAILPQHFLFNEDSYAKLKENSKQFLEWLDQNKESDGSSDSDSDSDSDGSSSDSGSSSDDE